MKGLSSLTDSGKKNVGIQAFLCSDYAAVIMTQIMEVVTGTAETTTTFFPPRNI